jgi:RNA polymerase sigma-70 factor (ECF subfamily)
MLTELDAVMNACVEEIDALHARCAQAFPNYRVGMAEFRSAVRNAIDKYLLGADNNQPLTPAAVRAFVSELQCQDLYLALACAQGNEHAWWDFDQNFRRYIERVARHLASAETDAEEVIDSVYVELYGTRVVDGIRQSKFATYSGRGTLRGWLRTVVWHAVIDLHRAKHDEISVDEWSETGGEVNDRPGWRAESRGGERSLLQNIERERYADATVAALDVSFAQLDAHEKLLLLYYHVEGLKLREIARLVEAPDSPLRRWFQRQSKQRLESPETRVHESTIMRWLEKVYGSVLKYFRRELETKGLTPPEIESCMALATQDLAGEDVRRHLSGATSDA